MQPHATALARIPINKHFCRWEGQQLACMDCDTLTSPSRSEPTLSGLSAVQSRVGLPEGMGKGGCTAGMVYNNLSCNYKSLNSM